MRLIPGTIMSMPHELGLLRASATPRTSFPGLEGVEMTFPWDSDIRYNIVRQEHCDMKREASMRVNENGRVVIPVSFRRRLGIRAGDELLLRIEDDELRITTLKRNIARGQQLVRQHVKSGASLVDELIAERR